MPEVDLQIRQMHVSDISEVSHIESHEQMDPWTPAIFRDCLQAGYDCFVLEQNTQQSSQIIAFIIWQTLFDECHLLNICVEPQHRNAGLGQRLLDFMFSRLEECAVRLVLLEVRASNQAAIHLYETKNQFICQGIRKAYYQTPSGREDALLFKKNM